MAKKSKLLKKLDKTNYTPIIHILGIVVVILFIINMFFVVSLTSSIKEKIAEAEEAARPANLELIIITANCEQCFNISTIVETIKAGNVNITKEETLNLQEAEELINTLNIRKLPTVIVKGELNKTNLNSTLTQLGDYLVFTNQLPPYYDTDSNDVKGLVVATIINTTNCAECVDVSPLLDELEQNGVFIYRSTLLTEEEGQDLVQTYNIEALPTLILSSDASEYQLIRENWAALGTQEFDGNYVLRNTPPPYKNVTTGEIEGLVTLTYVVDSSCEGCYNVTTHKTIVEGYGIHIVNETTIDASTQEGLEFARANNITLVPTIVLSNNAKIYTEFYQVYSQVSQETENGNLVFTSVELMGTHKNLETGEVIEPQHQ